MTATRRLRSPKPDFFVQTQNREGAWFTVTTCDADTYRSMRSSLSAQGWLISQIDGREWRRISRASAPLKGDPAK